MLSTLGVFIDGGYMDKILFENGGLRVDFGKLVEKVAEGHRLLRAYYYHCLPRQSGRPPQEDYGHVSNKEKFFHALQYIDNFEVRLGYLAYRGTDEQGHHLMEQKGVDVQMAVDMLTLSFNKVMDTAILVCGDGDLHPVVQKAKDMGVIVKLYHGDGPNTRVSEKLWYGCDQRILIDRDFLLACELTSVREAGRDRESGYEQE